MSRRQRGGGLGLGALAPVMKAVGLGAAGAAAKHALKNILGKKCRR